MSATCPNPTRWPRKRAASNRLLIIFCFFAIYVIWGSTYLAIRYAVETIPPLYAAGIRHLTSGTILLLWCLAKKVKPTAAQIRTGVVIGVLFFLLGHGPLHWAETRVPSGLASLLVATSQSLCFSWRRGRQAVAVQLEIWKRLFVGLAGVALLVGRTSLTSSTA